MKLTEQQEAAFQSSTVKELRDQVEALFQGKACADILGVALLSAAIVAAQEMGLPKLDVQKALIGIWDEEFRQRQSKSSPVSAGGKA